MTTFIWDFVHGSRSGDSSDLILGHIKYCKFTHYNDWVALNRFVDEYAHRAIFHNVSNLYLWICVKVYYGHILYIMPGICHNLIITVYLLVASLSNPEFWYISLSLIMAHKAETRLAIDV